eukprot:COSAG04_NODE_10887_length_746_cov_1.466770_1_plen_121_part_10
MENDYTLTTDDSDDDEGGDDSDSDDVDSDSDAEDTEFAAQRSAASKTVRSGGLAPGARPAGQRSEAAGDDENDDNPAPQDAQPPTSFTHVEWSAIQPPCERLSRTTIAEDAQAALRKQNYS